MREPIIKATHLGCRYGNKYILQGIDWEIYPGDHWLIFGLNGSGKTTLVTILAGYGYFSEGSLSVFGTPYTEENVLSKRKRIGLVSSSFFDRYYHDETVQDIVLSGLTGTLSFNMTITDRERKRALALAQALHIEDKLLMPFSRLSKGQRQNVLIARALINNPDILIMDEPATGLDVFNRELLLTTIKDLARHTAMTILYITHYTEEILPEFERTLLLKNGRVYRQGETEGLFESQPFSRFLDYPATVGPDPRRKHVTLTVSSTIRELLTDQRGEG